MVVKTTVKKDVSVMGRTVRKYYKFYFENGGGVKRVKAHAESDASGDGRPDTTCVKKHTVDVEDIPSDVLEEVSERMMTSAESV